MLFQTPESDRIYIFLITCRAAAPGCRRREVTVVNAASTTYPQRLASLELPSFLLIGALAIYRNALTARRWRSYKKKHGLY